MERRGVGLHTYDPPPGEDASAGRGEAESENSVELVTIPAPAPIAPITLNTPMYAPMYARECRIAPAPARIPPGVIPADHQVADNQRLRPPSLLSTGGRYSDPYQHQFPGYWWFKDPAAISALSSRAQRQFSHIGYIMETTLGIQQPADRACDRCRRAGFECWVYNTITSSQVLYASERCARCRAMAMAGGCKHSNGGAAVGPSEKGRPEDKRFGDVKQRTRRPRTTQTAG